MPDRRLIWLALALAVSATVFLTWSARGDWGFVLTYRGTKLAALLVIGVSIATATVAFQTVAGNRILTPSVMGLDALFVLLQTAAVFTLGGLGVAMIGPHLRFGIEAGLLLVAALALFGLLLGRGQSDLHRMVLAGIIFGVLFRSLSSLMERMIDPSEFAVVQSSTFARFSTVDESLLGLSALLCALAVAALWRMRATLDVLSLGREAAVSLGVAWRRSVLIVLALVALLVSVSTALVGPVTFFGLLVSALAHRTMRDHRHALLLPAAALIGALVLVGGQAVLERIFGLTTTLSVIVEFLGGLTFLFLVLKEPAR